MADGVRAREGDEVLRADDGDERRAPGERGRGRDEQSPKPRSAGGEREERQQERGPREARAEAETYGRGSLTFLTATKFFVGDRRFRHFQTLYEAPSPSLHCSGRFSDLYKLR